MLWSGIRRKASDTSARGREQGLDTPVRLAVVEEVADAVDRVLQERGDEENDDARGRRDVGNRIERGDEARRFRDIGKNQ